MKNAAVYVLAAAVLVVGFKQWAPSTQVQQGPDTVRVVGRVETYSQLEPASPLDYVTVQFDGDGLQPYTPPVGNAFVITALVAQVNDSGVLRLTVDGVPLWELFFDVFSSTSCVTTPSGWVAAPRGMVVRDGQTLSPSPTLGGGVKLGVIGFLVDDA